MDFQWLAEGVLGVLFAIGAAYINAIKTQFQIRLDALENKYTGVDVAFEKRLDHIDVRMDKMEDRFSEVSLQLARLAGQLEVMNSRMERLVDNMEILNRGYTDGRYE